MAARQCQRPADDIFSAAAGVAGVLVPQQRCAVGCISCGTARPRLAAGSSAACSFADCCLAGLALAAACGMISVTFWSEVLQAHRAGLQGNRRCHLMLQTRSRSLHGCKRCNQEHAISKTALQAHRGVVPIAVQSSPLVCLELLQQLLAFAAQHGSPQVEIVQHEILRAGCNMYHGNTSAPVLPALLARLPPGEAEAATDQRHEGNEHGVEPAVAAVVHVCSKAWLRPAQYGRCNQVTDFTTGGQCSRRCGQKWPCLRRPGPGRCRSQPARQPHRTLQHAAPDACAPARPAPCCWAARGRRPRLSRCTPADTSMCTSA